MWAVIEGYDPEEELVKAKLGLPFRCAVCGRVHRSERAVRRCANRVVREVSRVSGIFEAEGKAYLIPRALVALKPKYVEFEGEFYRKILEKEGKPKDYSIYECVTKPREIVAEMEKYWRTWTDRKRVLMEKFMEFPVEVREFEILDRDARGEITLIRVNGVRLSRREVVSEVFKQSDGFKWWGAEYAGRGETRYIHSTLLDLSEDMRYAVIRRDEKVLSRGVTLKRRTSKWFLATWGERVKISFFEVGAPIVKLVRKYGRHISPTNPLLSPKALG